MSLFIASLNSGSNGNCYYIGNESEAILIDAGISCKEIEKRMNRLGLPLKNIKAVFISHEHTDHIKGLPVFINKYQLPVYITSATMKNGGLFFENSLVKNFTAHEPVYIGSLAITAFPKFHDAIDPYSFVIKCNKTCVGVFTDIGRVCTHVKKYFQECHAVFLEANYDEDMLERGSYPFYLKNRIRNGNGHLSNKQALELFIQYKPRFMSHLFLSHLSKNNNDPQLVSQMFHSCAQNVKIVVASRYNETEVFHIHANEELTSGMMIPKKIKRPRPLQLSLSFT